MDMDTASARADRAREAADGAAVKEAEGEAEPAGRVEEATTGPSQAPTTAAAVTTGSARGPRARRGPRAERKGRGRKREDQQQRGGYDWEMMKRRRGPKRARALAAARLGVG